MRKMIDAPVWGKTVTEVVMENLDLTPEESIGVNVNPDVVQMCLNAITRWGYLDVSEWQHTPAGGFQNGRKYYLETLVVEGRTVFRIDRNIRATAELAVADLLARAGSWWKDDAFYRILRTNLGIPADVWIVRPQERKTQ